MINFFHLKLIKLILSINPPLKLLQLLLRLLLKLQLERLSWVVLFVFLFVKCNKTFATNPQQRAPWNRVVPNPSCVERAVCGGLFHKLARRKCCNWQGWHSRPGEDSLWESMSHLHFHWFSCLCSPSARSLVAGSLSARLTQITHVIVNADICGGRAVIYRTLVFPCWQGTFELSCMDDEVTATMKDVWKGEGKLQGIDLGQLLLNWILDYHYYSF